MKKLILFLLIVFISFGCSGDYYYIATIKDKYISNNSYFLIIKCTVIDLYNPFKYEVDSLTYSTSYVGRQINLDTKTLNIIKVE